MLGPSANGEISPSTPALDRFGDLAWEVRESIVPITAYLSAEGFSDLPGDGLLVLSGIAAGVSTAAMTSILGITEQEVNGTIGALVRHGYLEHRDVPPEDGRPRLTPTRRGRATTAAASTGLRVARWANFPFRTGDIVVCTWPKTGTTWVQWICALLVFQTPDLPAPLSELSAFVDNRPRPRDGDYGELAAQDHRRIMKTHQSLKDMPVDPRATYITVGRHPLDTALSLYHHDRNEKGGAPPAKAAHFRPPVPDQKAQRPPSSPHEDMLRWFDEAPAPQDRYRSLGGMLAHLSAAWARRDDPNLVLVHYEDLSADLEGEMRRIAAQLGITVPDATWPGLVKAATFRQMRANADQFVAAGARLKDPAAFFRRGVSGEGRALLTEAELARYHARAAQLAPPDLLAWLHR